MSPDRLKKVESLYHSVLELKGQERADLLEKARKYDPEIIAEVESLLAFETESESFIEQPAVEVAARSLSEDLSKDLIGKKIGSYKIESYIGGGGMGEVFCAIDERLGRRVALKLLSQTRVEDEEYIRRFEIEARAASALNHPDILTIFEFGKTDGVYFIATELVDGVTLRQRIDDKDLKLPEILKIAIQTAEALKTAHEAGIIHRDIKPENIMIRKDGYVKVLDFGLAKPFTEGALINEDGNNLTPMDTKTGRVLGTPNYMSPEQVRGQRVDKRTDIFSLGIVIYEMISNRKPFSGNSASAVIAAILLDEPKPLQEIAPNVPPDLEIIVGNALTKKRELRYATMDEMIADLKQLREQLHFESSTESYSSGSNKIVSKSLGQKNSWTAFSANNKLLLVASAVVLFSIAALAFYFYPTGESGKIESVAVMPFVNSNANSETQYLADGLTESIIDRLSKLSDFKVISFNAVSRYKEKEADAQTLGRELGVQTILFSRFTQNGEDVSINTELVSVRDNSRIWGFQYRGKNSDLLAMQESISKEISEKLNLKLSGADENVLAKRDTQNSEAFQLYLKGRYFWNKRTGEDLKRAIEFFNQAIEKDPAYALAFAGLADCYGLLSNYTDTPSSESMPKAKAAAQKALEIDDTLAEAHTSLGLVKKEYEWDFAGAEKDFKRAIELDPNYATAHQWRAENLVTLKRFDEALSEMNKARELDPFSLIINSEVGWVLHHAGRYDEAISQLRKTVELDPNFVRTHFFFGRVYEQKGMYKEAISSTEKAIKLSNGNTLFKASLAHIYATAGQKPEAEKILRELEKRSKTEYVSPFAFALIYTGLDEKDLAIEWLEKAYKQRDTILFNYIRDPQLKNLYSEPKFAELLRRVDLEP